MGLFKKLFGGDDASCEDKGSSAPHAILKAVAKEKVAQTASPCFTRTAKMRQC